MTTIEVQVDGRVCDFRFPTGGYCLARADHPIHHNAWFGGPKREPDHTFQFYERRKATEDRRR